MSLTLGGKSELGKGGGGHGLNSRSQGCTMVGGWMGGHRLSYKGQGANIGISEILHLVSCTGAAICTGEQ